jgi:hypothetical protein
MDTKERVNGWKIATWVLAGLLVLALGGAVAALGRAQTRIQRAEAGTHARVVRLKHELASTEKALERSEDKHLTAIRCVSDFEIAFVSHVRLLPVVNSPACQETWSSPSALTSKDKAAIDEAWSSMDSHDQKLTCDGFYSSITRVEQRITTEFAEAAEVSKELAARYLIYVIGTYC